MTKLHLGCGTRKIPGYTNIDIDPTVNPDLQDDVSQLYNIPNNSVDVIYACHVLEHFGRVEAKRVLSVWLNKLKDDGTLRISVPDMEKVFKHYILHGDMETLRGFLWGGQKTEWDYHKNGWDYASLRAILNEVGFAYSCNYDWRKTDHAHIDDYSQAYLPHMDKVNGLQMSLNIEAKKKVNTQSMFDYYMSTLPPPGSPYPGGTSPYKRYC